MGFEKLRIKKICAVFKYQPQSMHWRAINRTEHIIGIMLSGETMHDFGSRKLRFCKDGVYFLNQAEDYRADVLEISECYSIHFTTYEPIELSSFCRITAFPERIQRQIEQIDRLWQLHPDGNCKTMSALYHLLGEMEELTSIPYAPSDQSIIEAGAYLDLHFREKGCLDVAAEQSGLSRRRFNDRFKAQFQCTPNRYVTEKKIALAKELLPLQTLTVSQIASLCGFSDMYYFSKVFTEHTGINPSKYKK